MVALFEEFKFKFLSVVSFGIGYSCKLAEMRAYYYRLGVSVADNPYPGVPVEVIQVAFELCPEIGILYIVNLPYEIAVRNVTIPARFVPRCEL